MLTERERRLLAQIEAHLRRDEPALARLFTHGSPRRHRPTLVLRPRVRRPHPATLLGLIFTSITMVWGLGLVMIGIRYHSPDLLAGGLATAIVAPLPVWLVTSSKRCLSGLGFRA